MTIGQSIACAALALHINGTSFHHGGGGSYEYEERNWGAGVSCQARNGAIWSLDGFRDSYGDPSLYVYREWPLLGDFGSRVRLRVSTGLMYRRWTYDTHGWPLHPAVAPHLGIRATDRLALDLSYIPPMDWGGEERGAGAVTLQLRYRLR